MSCTKHSLFSLYDVIKDLRPFLIKPVTKNKPSTGTEYEVHFVMKIGPFAFLRHPLGNLGATYGDHLRLIGKRVVDFLLALTELFSLVVTAEELRAIIG